MNRMKFPFIPLLVFAMGMSACQYFEEGNVDLDNNGPDLLYVTVDELTYKMADSTYVNLDLAPGFHQLTIKDENQKELENLTFEVIEGGLINLAKAQYYVWSDIYGDQRLKEQKLNIREVEIGDKIYMGDFEAMPNDALYLESQNQWDYGLSEDFPGQLYDMIPRDERYKIRRKLYREQDLVADYMSQVEQPEPEAE
jgi:hypothetical protein